MLLLDSAAIVWLLIDSPRLGTRSRALLGNTTTAHFSAVSIAELTIKSMLGKITVPPDLSNACREAGLAELALTSAHAAALGQFPGLTRHDPFDRLLVAQAVLEGFDLMTPDRALLGLGRDFILDAAL